MGQDPPAVAEPPPRADLGLTIIDLEPLGHRMVDGLRCGQRADAVHETATRAHQRSRCRKDPTLEVGEFDDVLRADPPAGVGSTSERAEPAARSIHEDRVERRCFEGRLGRIRDAGLDLGHALLERAERARALLPQLGVASLARLLFLARALARGPGGVIVSVERGYAGARVVAARGAGRALRRGQVFAATSK